MTKLFALIITLSSFFLSAAQNDIQAIDGNSEILKQKSCFNGPFASYEKWLSFLSSKSKKNDIEALTKRFPKEQFEPQFTQLICQNFIYNVNGIEVEGFYLKSKENKGKKLPVIIYNRGGNGMFGYVNFTKKISFLGALASEGFIIIGSQYRGNSRVANSNEKDEFGGGDITDVVKLHAIASNLPDADISRLGMLGWSRGVMQSYQAAQQLPTLKTVVSIAGNSDAAAALEWRPSMLKVYRTRIPNFDNNQKAELAKRSVSQWLDKLPHTLSFLLIHGDEDKRVNVEQSISFAKQLKANNYNHKLVVYNKGDHGLRNHRTELHTELTNWFKSHL